MFCIHCGGENPAEARFCQACGKGIETGAPKEPAPSPPEPRKEPPADPPPETPTELRPPASLKTLGIIGIIVGAIQFLFNIVTAIVALAEVGAIGGAGSAVIAIIISLCLMLLSSVCLIAGSIGLVMKKLWGRTLCLIFGWTSVPLIFIAAVAVQTANAYMSTQGVDRSFEVMVGGGCFSPILGIAMLAILMTGEVARWVVFVRTGKVPLPAGAAPGAAAEGTVQMQKLNVPALLSLILVFVPFAGLNWIASIILGTVGLSRIRKSRGAQKGAGMAITGITLSSIVLLGIAAAITFAILGPMSSARRGANERAALSNLMYIGNSQEMFRQSDPDGNAQPDFWVGDIAGLNLLANSGEGGGVALIEAELADADGAPARILPENVQYTRFRSLPPAPIAKDGYLFQVISTYQSEDGDDRPLDEGGMRNRLRWTVCAYPAEYPDSGLRTFIISESHEIFSKDTGGAPLDRLPRYPPDHGWEPAN